MRASIKPTSYKIANGLWINVYRNGDFYLTKLLPSGIKPVSPLEADYKSIPKINTMVKLRDLANKLANK